MYSRGRSRRRTEERRHENEDEELVANLEGEQQLDEGAIQMTVTRLSDMSFSGVHSTNTMLITVTRRTALFLLANHSISRGTKNMLQSAISNGGRIAGGEVVSRKSRQEAPLANSNDVLDRLRTTAS
jgi:hypothetical protein